MGLVEILPPLSTTSSIYHQPHPLLRQFVLFPSLQKVGVAARGPGSPPHAGPVRSGEGCRDQELSGGGTGVPGQAAPGTG